VNGRRGEEDRQDKLRPEGCSKGDFTFDGGMVVAIQKRITENKQINAVMDFSPVMCPLVL
jgi:hypothetical protein